MFRSASGLVVLFAACAAPLDLSEEVTSSGMDVDTDVDVIEVEVIERFDPERREHPEAVLVGADGRVWVTLHGSGELYVYDPQRAQGERRTLPGIVRDGTTVFSGLARLEDRVFMSVNSENSEWAGVWRVDEDTPYRVIVLDPQRAWNGMAADGWRTRLFLTDSSAGEIMQADPRRGDVQLWTSGAYLEPTHDGWGGAFGVNGIAVQERSIVVSVSATQRLWEIPILADGSAGSPMPFLAEFGLGSSDDFDLDVSGRFWLGAQFADDRIELIDRTTGELWTLADVDAGIDQPSATAFSPNEPGIAYAVSAAFGGIRPTRSPSLMRLDWSAFDDLE